jgi:hypothetical protein
MTTKLADKNVLLTMFVSLAALLFSTNGAVAQEYWPPVQQPWGYGSYNFGVGTYESSVLEGTGKLLQGAGYYNLTTAQARDTLEMARSKSIQNDRDTIEARYTIKRVNDMYRAQKYAQERMSPEMLSRVIKAKRPEPLGAAQYNRGTGELVWQSVLMTAEFSNDRRAIEQAFAHQHGEKSGAASNFYREVSQSAQRMHDKMLSQIAKLSTTDSIAARRFLKSVEYEARLVAVDIR